jgi:hypothetical protein
MDGNRLAYTFSIYLIGDVLGEVQVQITKTNIGTLSGKIRGIGSTHTLCGPSD